MFDAKSSMPSTGNMDQGSKPKKRIITTARREQNKAAQRAWRQRQRQNCSGLTICHERPKPKLKPSSRALGTSLPVTNSTTAQQNSQEISTTHPKQTSASEIDYEDPGGIDPDSSLNSLDVTPPDVSSETLTSDQELVLSKDPSIAFLQTDPKLNTLQPTQTQTLLAFLHNATCLGFDISDLMTCDKRSMSPFFSSIAPTDDPQSLVANKFNPSIPIHLQPTMAQILVPHHAALDLIPLPLLRDRAIMLSFAMPEIFDLWDLKLDIYVRHGIVLKTGGDRLPWDPKNWDMKPWFAKKWGMPVCE
ncbi:hypothetical protein N7494_004265 [Penicillium frequentans]|uniref:BZIP domain-containing protein n=1 Tax=Penicillium frequentans TaxID=3151616 RepID=A0AAD6D0A9_9EURO|nr:hypothetical protein N7494_004265 [Penicillium glabrum]